MSRQKPPHTDSLGDVLQRVRRVAGLLAILVSVARTVKYLRDIVTQLR